MIMISGMTEEEKDMDHTQLGIQTGFKNQTKRITFTALLMALNIGLSSFAVPVPGGHFYLNDVVICIAAILLNPVDAFIVGGVGAFLGDLFFYPLPMFVSLATHGLQAVVISLFVHKGNFGKEVVRAGIGVAIGAVIMVLGYTLGKIFVYSTLEYAIMKLPFEILQAVVGAVVGVIVCYQFGIKKIFTRFMTA